MHYLVLLFNDGNYASLKNMNFNVQGSGVVLLEFDSRSQKNYNSSFKIFLFTSNHLTEEKLYVRSM